MSIYKAPDDGFVLDIEWDKPGLPNLVGPFATRDEADEWARLNIPNGSFVVRPLAWPYYRSDRNKGDAQEATND